MPLSVYWCSLLYYGGMSRTRDKQQNCLDLLSVGNQANRFPEQARIAKHFTVFPLKNPHYQQRNVTTKEQNISTQTTHTPCTSVIRGKPRRRPSPCSIFLPASPFRFGPIFHVRLDLAAFQPIEGRRQLWPITFGHRGQEPACGKEGGHAAWFNSQPSVTYFEGTGRGAPCGTFFYGLGEEQWQPQYVNGLRPCKRLQRQKGQPKT